MGQRRIDSMKMFLLTVILLAIIIAPVVGMALINDRGSSAPSQSSVANAAVSTVTDIAAQGMAGSDTRIPGDSSLWAPKPLTLMLLGTVLVGLAGWGRKKFRR